MNLRKLPAALIAGLLLCTGFARAETLPIGTLGAAIPAEDLKRQVISADLGKDQFIVLNGDGYLVFFELFGLFEQRVDFEARLDLLVSLIEARMTETTVDPTLYFEDMGAFSRATRQARGEASGIRLAYQFDLVSAGDGLGYMVLSWSNQSAFQKLEEKVDQVIAGLRLPGEDSEWAEKTVPSVHSYEFGDWTVDMTFRDSVFTLSPESEPGQRYTFSADGDQVAVHLFVIENEDDLEETMSLIREAADPDGDYEKLSSSDLELEVGTGRQMLLRTEDEGVVQDLALATIELGDDHWIDLRMLTTAAAGHRDELWEGLLETMRITAPRDLDAYPIAEDDEAPEALFLTAAGRALLGASRFLGFGPGDQTIVPSPEGGFLQRDPYGIAYLPERADAEEAPTAEDLYTTDDFLSGTAVPAGGKVFYVTGDSTVSVVADGSLEPAGFTARQIAPLGDDILLARRDESASLDGLMDLPAVGGTKLYRRAPGGEETLLLELPEDDLVALAVNGNGEALMAALPVIESEGEEQAKVRLLTMKARGGSAAELGRWQEVRLLTAADGGWLVSGRPESGLDGIYLVTGAGEPDLLIQGEGRGLTLQAGELTFVTLRCLEPAQEGRRSCIYRAPVAQVREHGAGFWPFDTQLFNRIGAKLQEASPGCCSGLPATRDEVSSLFAAADAACKELTGAPLPASQEGLDAWLWALTDDLDVSEGGLFVATLAFSEALLREGAEWVPPEGSRGTPPSYLGLEERNPFALGVHPRGVILTLIYEEESWYTAVERINTVADGRKIYLGSDAAAIEAKAKAAAAPSLGELLREGRTKRLQELLEAQPENLHLRRYVYKHLAAFGHREAVLELAARRSRSEDAEDLDRIAFFAARLGGEVTEKEALEAVQELRNAVAASPRTQEYYLLLGQAYEKTALGDRLDKARACYRKVVDLGRWTSASRQAEARLEDLAGEEDEA